MYFKVLYEFPSADIERSWRDCLTRVEMPSHCDAPEYFLEPLRMGDGPFAVLAVEDDRVRGVLTGFRLGRHVMCGLPSRPQICVDSIEDAELTVETLAQGLLAEADSAELVSVYTWASRELKPFSARGFRTRQLPGSVVLDLTHGAVAVFKQFSKDRRRNIRYAEKHGVEVSEATTPRDIVEAYAVYSAWRGTERKKVRGSWSFESFEKTVTLRNNRRLFLARFEGKVIAINIFRFFPGGLFQSTANSSLDEFIYLKPNDLLQWKGIEWACSQGLRRHSLGGSHGFLLRFGGTVVPILRYRLDRTWLHRHDLRETVRAFGGRIYHKLQPFVEKAFPKLEGRKKG
jgi:Acetyltransferase (GNAT) domain